MGCVSSKTVKDEVREQYRPSTTVGDQSATSGDVARQSRAKLSRGAEQQRSQRTATDNNGCTLLQPETASGTAVRAIVFAMWRQRGRGRSAPRRKTWQSRRQFYIRYDTRCYFNVRSKADISRLNLPHRNMLAVYIGNAKACKNAKLRVVQQIRRRDARLLH